MNYNINELLNISNKLQERIDAIANFNKGEMEFGKFMQENIKSTSDLISLESIASFVLIDGPLALKGMLLMNQHLCNWKNVIDVKIRELEEAEFPSEGVVLHDS